ncbi:unnamed protein product [Prorocentrum cordatum]|uniref:Protein kinase domain-containing protein n=1 Tax=Prorocentrum cordatum TaxID=2364126 RepID=A0ABN9SBY9_9DINO|nr:unnamed protein product [Polarella glacialis]
MSSSSSDGRRWRACCDRLCHCCRRARYENGVDRFTLRFEDPMQEAGFAKAHKARLSHRVLVMMALFTVVGIMTIMSQIFLDQDQNAMTEARELSRLQTILYFALMVSVNLGLGFGTLFARCNLIGTLGLEIAVVITCSIVLIAMPLITKHYLARAFGYDDTKAIWGVDMSPTDGTLVLYIDCVVTAVHLLVPVRWVVLAPLEAIAFLAYAVPALTLGSPAVQIAHGALVGLLALTVFAALGKRAFERQERAMFKGLLAEKQMRFQAEFQLSRVDRGESAAGREDVGSSRSVTMSCPETTKSALVFDGCGVDGESMGQIRAIGLREQWLIANGEVELVSDRVLGEGGFGIVVAGLYHNTLVAVKAPKEGIVRAALPTLCNELKILRRLRHPNIASFYGACMDAALNKLCLVLEFVDGVSLGFFIRGLCRGPDQPEDSCGRAGALDRSASARPSIVFDILNVLRYLHSREPAVVHGDLKDSNIFVEERLSRSGRTSFHAKLLDFGLSRIITRRAKPLGGTLRWMAPELVLQHAVPPDTAADCYSFGLLTYFIVTGSLPFEGANAERMLKRLRHGQSPSLSWPEPADELTQACRLVVEQCTKPMPALRPAAQQISNDLTTMLNNVVEEALDTAVEALTPGKASRGGTTPPGTRSPGRTEACDSDGPACKGLAEFSGVVEVRQASSSSSRSLVPNMGSSFFPPVPEHGLLQPGGATDGAAAELSSSPGKERGQLANPQYQPTPLSTQVLTLSYLLMQWNVPMPKGICCWLHGSLVTLDKVRNELGRRPCSMRQCGIHCGQCDTCGLLLMQGMSVCEFCEVPGSSIPSTTFV